MPGEGPTQTADIVFCGKRGVGDLWLGACFGSGRSGGGMGLETGQYGQTQGDQKQVEWRGLGGSVRLDPYQGMNFYTLLPLPFTVNLTFSITLEMGKQRPYCRSSDYWIQ